MNDQAIVELVDRFLRLCEERKLAEAGELLAADARLVFPGGTVFSDLAAMAAGGATRYEFVTKDRDEYSVGTRMSDGARVCVSTGRLSGVTLSGSAFSGVRYIDTFVIRDGRIHEQHVWNDLAELGIVSPGRAGGPS